MDKRVYFNEADVAAWRDEGFAIMPGFFTEADIATIRSDYDRLYRENRVVDGECNEKPADKVGEFNTRQFMNIETLPYDGSLPLNMASLHPGLIEFAKAALGVESVRLYQSHTWAKFTGEANYDQPFHCDFGNHTLMIPSDDAASRTVDFIMYFTDVTDAHGALHYVPKSDVREILRDGAVAAPDDAQQAALKAVERSAAAPAGTVVAHGIDTFHRGTNLTAPDGYRYTMTAGYKAAGNDMVSYHVWQSSAERDWSAILANGSPEQLACLGIPLPGDDYWTARTLKLTQARWPDWDMRRWFEAARA